MFSTLTEKINSTLKKIQGRAKLSAHDVEAFSRELRLHLLAADVHYQVAKEFSESVAEKAMGARIAESFHPDQVFQKVVYETLVATLGSETCSPSFLGERPHVVFLVGLTGSGKTTSLAKLAKWWHRKGERPLLVSTDVRRPAAQEQLKVLGESLGIEVFPSEGEKKAKKILKNALAQGKKSGFSLLLVDTAGRLHVEKELMEELKDLVDQVGSPKIFYVLDISAGQDALRAVSEFKSSLPLAGLLISKLDGDAKGGAVLSVKTMTGLPIFFAGVGEQLDDFEIFAPDRLASRIMGSGDIATLAEKIEEGLDRENLEKAQKQWTQGSFNLDDLRNQFRQAQKMGGMEKWLQFLPGASQMKGLDPQKMEKEISHKEAMINSMTPKERENPTILNGSRRKRIALGSGVSVAEVNRLLKEYEAMRHWMKQKGGIAKILKRLDLSKGR